LQTVKLHRGRLMRKLQLHSVAELVRLAEKARSLLPGLCTGARPRSSPDYAPGIAKRASRSS
jgi:hypothetical protein